MDALTERPTQLTPPDSPLPMPLQNFDEWSRPAAKLPLGARTAFARVFVFSLTALLSSYAVWEMHQVIGQGNATALQYVLLFLFGLTFIWIAFAAANALLGFIITKTSSERSPRGLALTTRTAVAMPIHNENTKPVFSSIARMADDLVQSAEASHFDLFVLSDTTEHKIAEREEQAIRSLRDQFGDQIAIYYRRREQTEGRKAGNIANFVQRWGGSYDHMIVLDADSYMTADSMIRLARVMQEHPTAGLIQTAPKLINGKTLFARLQEFATAVYGPVLSRGLSLWYGSEGNYWGHNAIIRVRAFAAACGLPRLSGQKPFGGEIMSHDFIEAALLRRAGFGVYMSPDIDGSYEETPPSLSDHIARDRRWAQGNLQHSRILGAAGLHWLSRFHLVHGIMSYIVSPLWLMFLATGIILSWEAEVFPPNYFPSDFALFPSWPRFDAERAMALLQFSVAVLLLPKLLGLIKGLTEQKIRATSGGASALVLGVILETFFSALLAPILMLTQTRFIIDILRGKDSGWAVQKREAEPASLRDATKGYIGHAAVGFLLCVGTLLISAEVCLWLSPVWLGLILAIPIAHFTSLALDRRPSTQPI
jgi:membrane glycosyltransferase